MDKNKTFIIAELSANHNGSLEVAIDTLKAIKKSGADAVKIQTYTADTITLDCDNKYFKINQGTLWDGTTLYQLYKEAYTPWEWHEELKHTAEELGLVFFSSPFDFSAIDFLESLDVSIYKIASFEITDIPLIEYAASTGKPIIISTGIATLSDIELAVNACRKKNNNDITLLHCVSSYPAPAEGTNLNTMKNLQETFNVKVGLSDHSIGQEIAVAAVALGAKVIEKHYILDRKLGGVDSKFSMEPDEFKKMVHSIRNVEKALGSVDYSLTEKKKTSRQFSRSLFIVKDVKKGETLTKDNIKSIRPGFGMSPSLQEQVLGKKFTNNFLKGTPLSWTCIN